MAIYRRTIACGIALWLAFAGLVALSPVLHHWIEHGGQGPLHVHGKFSNALAHLAAAEPKLFEHERPFDLPFPKIDLARALRVLSQALGNSHKQRGNPAGHEHHSLPQLLAAGSLDQEIIFEFFPPTPIATGSKPLTPTTPVCIRFHIEPPGRAPPASRS